MAKILNLVTAINYIQIKELPALTLNPHTIIAELSRNREGRNYDDLLLISTIKGWALCSEDKSGPITLGPGKFTFVQKPLPPAIDLSSYPETTTLRIVMEEEDHAVLQELTVDSE